MFSSEYAIRRQRYEKAGELPNNSPAFVGFQRFLRFYALHGLAWIIHGNYKNQSNVFDFKHELPRARHPAGWRLRSEAEQELNMNYSKIN